MEKLFSVCPQLTENRNFLGPQSSKTAGTSFFVECFLFNNTTYYTKFIFQFNSSSLSEIVRWTAIDLVFQLPHCECTAFISCTCILLLLDVSPTQDETFCSYYGLRFLAHSNLAEVQVCLFYSPKSDFALYYFVGLILLPQLYDILYIPKKVMDQLSSLFLPDMTHTNHIQLGQTHGPCTPTPKSNGLVF